MQFIQIRAFCALNQESLKAICDNFNLSRIENIEIICPFSEQLDDVNFIRSLSLLQPRLYSMVLYSANTDHESLIEPLGLNLIKTKIIIDSSIHCGIVDSYFFSINISTYTESQHHNTCLNRKISIDVNGEIKNCPSMAKSYGNIKDTTLQEALDRQGFKDVWTINKDQIAVCQDCEFRHICTDCRAYVENPADIYSKPLKCGYNPYTAEWEEWSTNPLKQKAIEFYGMQELVKNEL